MYNNSGMSLEKLYSTPHFIYTCSLRQMWLLVQQILKVHLCMMGEFGTVMAAECAAVSLSTC